MSIQPIIFMKGELIKPEELPPVLESDGGLGYIKKGVLKGFTAISWSPQMNKWIYIAYDDTEKRKIQTTLGSVDCYTIMELHFLSGCKLSEAAWNKITLVKKIFGASVLGVTEIKEPNNGKRK